MASGGRISPCARRAAPLASWITSSCRWSATGSRFTAQAYIDAQWPPPEPGPPERANRYIHGEGIIPAPPSTMAVRAAVRGLRRAAHASLAAYWSGDVRAWIISGARVLSAI